VCGFFEQPVYYAWNDIDWYDGYTCPDDPGMGGATPGMCEDVGAKPNRSATCNGEAVDEEIPVPGPIVVLK
jgi:hypothetical protein